MGASGPCELTELQLRYKDKLKEKLLQCAKEMQEEEARKLNDEARNFKLGAALARDSPPPHCSMPEPLPWSWTLDPGT
jgi:hypothetical protein